MNYKLILKFAPRFIAALILLQTLYFKFGIGGPEALAESQDIFSILSLELFGSAAYESWIRIGTGILELITAFLIVLPNSALYGAIMGIALMSGAILSHLLFIGVSVKDDGGSLFTLAIIVLLCCVKVAFDDRQKLTIQS